MDEQALFVYELELELPSFVEFYGLWFAGDGELHEDGCLFSGDDLEGDSFQEGVDVVVVGLFEDFDVLGELLGGVYRSQSDLHFAWDLLAQVVIDEGSEVVEVDLAAEEGLSWGLGLFEV